MSKTVVSFGIELLILFKIVHWLLRISILNVHVEVDNRFLKCNWKKLFGGGCLDAIINKLSNYSLHFLEK